MIKRKIVKGDKVKVITGKYKGKIGNVIQLFPSKNTAIVSGVNIVKKHTKPTKSNEGGIFKKEQPVHLSNISLIDPKTGEATKVRYEVLENGDKVRVAKKSGEIIEKHKGDK